MECHPCSTSCFLPSAPAGSPLLLPMLRSRPNCEGAMTDPVIALAVAVGLGAYLVYTLLHPERF